MKKDIELTRLVSVQEIKSVQKYTFIIFRLRSTFSVQILEQFKRSKLSPFSSISRKPLNFIKLLKKRKERNNTKMPPPSIIMRTVEPTYQTKRRGQKIFLNKNFKIFSRFFQKWIELELSIFLGFCRSAFIVQILISFSSVQFIELNN